MDENKEKELKKIFEDKRDKMSSEIAESRKLYINGTEKLKEKALDASVVWLAGTVGLTQKTENDFVIIFKAMDLWYDFLKSGCTAIRNPPAFIHEMFQLGRQQRLLDFDMKWKDKRQYYKITLYKDKYVESGRLPESLFQNYVPDHPAVFKDISKVPQEEIIFGNEVVEEHLKEDKWEEYLETGKVDGKEISDK